MAVGKKKAVLMKAVSELKAEDYSKMPELEGIYKRLASGPSASRVLSPRRPGFPIYTGESQTWR